MVQTNNILEIHEIHKFYAKGTNSEVHALRGIDLTIKKGEMVAIMGTSGCGKTTLLNIIGGIDQFDSGDLLIDGIDIRSFSDTKMTEFRAKNIGFIFQLFNLFPFLTATQNVMFPLLILKRPRVKARQEAELLLRELGLGGHLKHYPSQLSGGQQQRVAIARSLITQPTILLGDEPTGDLDFTTSSDIIQLFRRINRENKQTLILVTHSKWIAKQCDRIIEIGDGKILTDIQNGGKN